LAEDLISLLLFGAGVAIGREVQAKRVRVPPEILYLPKPEEYLREKYSDAESTLKKALREQNPDLPEEEVDRRAKEILDEAQKGSSSGLSSRARDFDRLQRVVEGFWDGKIDTSLYLFLVRKYVDRLADTERKAAGERM
jgi:hypothetical protein